MTAMQQSLVPVSGWAVFGWYCAGVGLRFIYNALDIWVRKPDKPPWTEHLAVCGKEAATSLALSVVWTQGLALSQHFGVPIPPIQVTAVSSIAAGFFLHMLVAERLHLAIGRWRKK